MDALCAADIMHAASAPTTLNFIFMGLILFCQIKLLHFNIILPHSVNCKLIRKAKAHTRIVQKLRSIR